MIREVGVSAARKELADLMDEVVRRGVPVRVVRRRGDRALLIEDGQLLAMLRAFSFHPQRSTEPDGSVSYWLPELELGANGPSEAAARRALAGEVEDYADDWLSQVVLRLAPNRRHHLGWVLRAALGSSAEEIEAAIFAG